MANQQTSKNRPKKIKFTKEMWLKVRLHEQAKEIQFLQSIRKLSPLLQDIATFFYEEMGGVTDLKYFKEAIWQDQAVDPETVKRALARARRIFPTVGLDWDLRQRKKMVILSGRSDIYYPR